MTKEEKLDDLEKRSREAIREIMAAGIRGIETGVYSTPDKKLTVDAKDFYFEWKRNKNFYKKFWFFAAVEGMFYIFTSPKMMGVGEASLLTNWMMLAAAFVVAIYFFEVGSAKRTYCMEMAASDEHADDLKVAIFGGAEKLQILYKKIGVVTAIAVGLALYAHFTGGGSMLIASIVIGSLLFLNLKKE